MFKRFRNKNLSNWSTFIYMPSLTSTISIHLYIHHDDNGYGTFIVTRDSDEITVQPKKFAMLSLQTGSWGGTFALA